MFFLRHDMGEQNLDSSLIFSFNPQYVPDISEKEKNIGNLSDV